MGSPQLDVLLSTVAESLDADFRVDGATHALSAFDGVVSVEEGATDAGRYYAWRAVSLGDSYGIELESPDGIVHTHSLSYFTGEVVADRYRPARLDGDDVVVAARREHTSPPESSTARSRSSDDTTTDGSTSGAAADAVEEERQTHGRDGNAGASRENDPGDTRDPRDRAADPGSDTAEVLDETDDRSVTGTSAGAAGTATDASVTPDHGAEVIRDSHGSGDGEDDTAGDDSDGSGNTVGDDSELGDDTLGDGTDGTAAVAGDHESDGADGHGGDGMGGAVDAENDGTDDSVDVAAGGGTADGADAVDPTDAEIGRLERIATDPTRHELVRQNAIHELAEFGADAAEALATVSTSGVDERERALADELRAEFDDQHAAE